MSFTNEQLDVALTLEEGLQKRIREHASPIVNSMVKHEIEKHFTAMKENMMMELSLTIGRLLKSIEDENRRPLWESTPEDFGLTKKQLISSQARPKDIFEEDLRDALHKQT
jgi:siroheme synthase (precorrin-2 oxidase/ferrochelatase)